MPTGAVTMEISRPAANPSTLCCQLTGAPP
jgi:hypothetical protein